MIASSHRQQAFTHVLMVNMPAHVSVLTLIERLHLLLFSYVSGNILSNRHWGHHFSLDQFLWKAVCTSKIAVSPVLQAGEQDIIAVTWSPTKPSLVMALNSHSQLILLHINSQTCQPKVFDFGNTTSPSKGTKAAITVSSCLISAGKPFQKFSWSVHYWLQKGKPSTIC